MTNKKKEPLNTKIRDEMIEKIKSRIYKDNQGIVVLFVEDGKLDEIESLGIGRVMSAHLLNEAHYNVMYQMMRDSEREQMQKMIEEHMAKHENECRECNDGKEPVRH